MRIFVLALSKSTTSLNKKLAYQIEQIAIQHGAIVDLAQFEAFPLPLFNPELISETIQPEGVSPLLERITSCDAIIFAAPEYNYSIASPFKSLIDWVSRVRPQPWRGRKILLTAASPSLCGGIRGLWAARVPLEGCGAFVYPDMFSLPEAHTAFEATGSFKNQKYHEQLSKMIGGFFQFVACR